MAFELTSFGIDSCITNTGCSIQQIGLCKTKLYSATACFLSYIYIPTGFFSVRSGWNHLLMTGLSDSYYIAISWLGTAKCSVVLARSPAILSSICITKCSWFSVSEVLRTGVWEQSGDGKLYSSAARESSINNIHRSHKALGWIIGSWGGRGPMHLGRSLSRVSPQCKSRWRNIPTYQRPTLTNTW